jgi:hypothetical protein
MLRTWPDGLRHLPTCQQPLLHPPGLSPTHLIEFHLLLDGHQRPIAELEDSEHVLVDAALVLTKLAVQVQGTLKVTELHRSSIVWPSPYVANNFARGGTSDE